MANDRIPVDCTSVVVVVDGDDDDDDAAAAAAAAADVVDDDADDKERPLDGSLGVTHEICCLANGNYHLLKQPKPEARMNSKMPGVDANAPCQKNAS